MHRYDLTDVQWLLLEPLFPDRHHGGKAGHPWNDLRPLVNGILIHMFGVGLPAALAARAAARRQ